MPVEFATTTAPQPPRVRLAADIGGTFTDLVLQTPARRHSCKLLTTPQQPEVAVMDGIAQLLAESGQQAADVGLLVHGTTLATNALIERKGARTALLTTQGFRDVLEMGYEKRYEQYDIHIRRPPELVPRALRFTVPERMAVDGQVLLPLDEAAVARAAQAMREAGVQAVAVGFLHAYAWPAHEQRARAILADVLGPAVTICLSGEVCPEMREYERLSTTCAKAYVRPLMDGYLGRLRERMDSAGLACPLLMMMSGGGVTTLDQARRFPVRLVESGPAGGALLAAQLARDANLHEVMAFDMGGTTAKLCLISQARPQRARRFEVGRVYRNLKGSGLPLRIPVIELVEIGAGGGSLARVDGLQRISVGPDSAGAEPGPACYGRGGVAPTVTDANLVLGRMDAKRFAAGRIPLDMALATRALQDAIAAPLQLDAFWAAAGVSEIVDENMANAARVHAIERGKSIADCTLIAFGGGAPLHAARLAQKLGLTRILVPAGAGVGSAIGFLAAPVSFEVVRSAVGLLAAADVAGLNARLAAMEAQARAVVQPAAAAQGLGAAALQVQRLVDMRYVGQGHELQIALPGGALAAAQVQRLREDFERAYEHSYGLRIADSGVEAVTWSVTVSTPAAPAVPVRLSSRPPLAMTNRSRHVWDPDLGRAQDFDLHWRFDLPPLALVLGPALIAEDETTTVVPTGWQAQLDDAGHLHLSLQEAVA